MLISGKDWAAHEGISPQAANKRIRAHRIPRHAGKIDPDEARRIFEAEKDILQQERGTAGKRSENDYSRRRPDILTARDEVRLRREKLKLDQEDGKLVPAAEVERTWGEVVTSIKNNLLALPDDLAPKVAIVSDVRRCRQIIDHAIREVLIALSGEPELNDAA